MRQLVNDLLEYSRVETKGRRFSAVDMSVVATEVRDELRVAINEVEAEVQIDPLPMVFADGSQMKQLLSNLISNAIKFRDGQRPVVEVSARGSDGAWVFAVKDNGIGIDSRFKDKLFLMFQRLHTRDEYPGTGIGLAIAKKIVERHGGQIWVESDGKSGSTFFFTLPKIRRG
jgi:light-regulated signal transduction histidine kinase (bacteriophytochrome)